MVTVLPLRLYIIMMCMLLLCYLFSVISIPTAYKTLRPEVLCLITMYWVIHLPQHFGISFAFFIGLAQDIVEQSVWGAHALALAVVAYCCVSAYQRIKSYSIWHQSMWIFVLVGVHQILVNWVQSLTGYHAPLPNLLTSIVITALMWPAMVWCLRRLRQRYHLF